MRHSPLLLMAALCSACRAGPGPYQPAAVADTVDVVPLARLALMIDGFAAPGSATYDADQDVYFVSNMNGDGAVKDDNGYIIRIDAARPSLMETFIRGGRDSVTLHAPKGMAIVGDLLWVADIDALRSFDRSTGAPRQVIDLGPYDAVMLTDVMAGADGMLYVTDTGAGAMAAELKLPGARVFVISQRGHVRVLAPGEAEGRPRSVAWDTTNRKRLSAPFDAGQGAVDVVNAALDTRRNRLVVPLARPGRIEIWQLLD